MAIWGEGRVVGTQAAKTCVSTSGQLDRSMLGWKRARRPQVFAGEKVQYLLDVMRQMEELCGSVTFWEWRLFAAGS